MDIFFKGRICQKVFEEIFQSDEFLNTTNDVLNSGLSGLEIRKKKTSITY